MAEIQTKAIWTAFGSSVPGASHLRSGLPNQDAISWSPESGRGPGLVLSVSDGHGSPKYFRSDVGACLAVEAAAQTMKSLIDLQTTDLTISDVKRMAGERLARRLVQTWKEAVEQHVAANPFTDAEWARLSEREEPAARRTVTREPVIAYGATIQSILLTETFALYLQLGDGVALTVDAVGHTSRILPKDEAQVGDDTDSLCLPNAWERAQIRILPLIDYPPSLFILTTDGYYKSFVSEEDFLRIGPDYLELVRTVGLRNLELVSILEDNSRRGSGDDVTLGLIKRDEVRDWDNFDRRLMDSTKRLAKVEIELAQQEARADEDYAHWSAALADHARDEAQMREALGANLKQSITDVVKARAALASEQGRINAEQDETNRRVRDDLTNVGKRQHTVSDRLTVLQGGLILSLVLAIAALALTAVLWSFSNRPSQVVPIVPTPILAASPTAVVASPSPTDNTAPTATVLPNPSPSSVVASPTTALSVVSTVVQPTVTVVNSSSPVVSPSPTRIVSPTPTVYTVRSGDTLAAISERFGVPIKDIMDVNHLASTTITIGQNLIIPPK